jgi:hypothetical protein
MATMEQALEPVNPVYETALREELKQFLPLRDKPFEDAVAKRDEMEKTLGYLQWCDGLESTNAGAILGFSAVMLAADLVLLSAENSSCIAINGWPALLAFLAVIPLSVTAILALWAFVTSRYTGNDLLRPVNILGRYSLHINHRIDLNQKSTICAIVGVVLFLSALAIRFYAFLVAGMTCSKLVL